MKRLLIAVSAAIGSFILPTVALAEKDQSAVLELVTFRTATGVENEVLLERARGIDPVLRTMPGFVERRLAQAPDGSWIDALVWTSLEDAEAAAASIGLRPEGQAFFEVIDPSSIDLRHAPIMSTSDLLD